MSLSMTRLTTLALTTVTLAAVVLVTGCGSLGGSPTTGSATPTPTPIVVDGVTYTTVTDAMFGFQIDLPVELKHQQTLSEPATGGDFNAWTGTLPGAVGEVDVRFGGNTTGVYANQCPQAIPDATTVTVGSGLTGYQTENLLTATPPPQAASGGPLLSVGFVAKGVVIGMTLDGTPPGDTFMQRDGGIWQHMLASFKPGSYVNATPPCGS